MDYLIGVSGTIKFKQKRGFLSFNERSVFHKVAVVSAGTSPCLASSSVQVEVGVSLCLGCGGGERMQGRRRIRYLEALVHWKLKVTVWAPQEQDSGSECLLPAVPLTECLPAGRSRSKSGSHKESCVGPPSVLSVAPTRSNAVLSLDLRCLNQLVLGSSFQL